MKRVHLFVTGRVQGVFFRASTREQANRLGVKGLARNLPDGRVEIVAEGDEQALQNLIKWVHIGPPHAQVEQVETREEEATGEFSRFMIA